MKSRWWWNLCERLLDFVPSGRWLPFCRCFFFFYFKNITYRMVFLFLIFFVFVSASNHHNPLSSNRRLGSSGFLFAHEQSISDLRSKKTRREERGRWWCLKATRLLVLLRRPPGEPLLWSARGSPGTTVWRLHTPWSSTNHLLGVLLFLSPSVIYSLWSVT